MLNRIYIKDFLSIKNVILDIDSNFVVFSGPSGAGKSIFMNALLSCFGFCKSDATVVDLEIEANLDFEKFGIEKENIYNFQRTKNKATKHFINNQSVSKKIISEITNSFINYLSVNDDKEFSSSSLLHTLDTLISKEDSTYLQILIKLKSLYETYTSLKSEFEDILNNEKNQSELKEFLKYEIDKIATINPKKNELEELISTKKDLSKKEKILNKIEEANSIFNFENKVYEALNILDISLPSFDDSMNELRDIFENHTSRLENLEDLDIEDLLNRVEKLSDLKLKYGSIEEALEYKKTKESELEKLENITWEKDNLAKELEKTQKELLKISKSVTKKRESKVENLEVLINEYLSKMYLKDITLSLEESAFSALGMDKINIELNQTDLKKISTGELNRVKLAFLAAKNSILMEKSESILFLDEVDSNLSGKESMSVAKVLKELSKNYQIFAISHQPQLSSIANTHFLVDKQNENTTVSQLSNKEREEEVARMVSGENITKEALQLARTLLN